MSHLSLLILKFESSLFFLCQYCLSIVFCLFNDLFIGFLYFFPIFCFIHFHSTLYYFFSSSSFSFSLLLFFQFLKGKVRQLFCNLSSLLIHVAFIAINFPLSITLADSYISASKSVSCTEKKTVYSATVGWSIQ